MAGKAAPACTRSLPRKVASSKSAMPWGRAPASTTAVRSLWRMDRRRAAGSGGLVGSATASGRRPALRRSVSSVPAAPAAPAAAWKARASGRTSGCWLSLTLHSSRPWRAAGVPIARKSSCRRDPARRASQRASASSCAFAPPAAMFTENTMFWTSSGVPQSWCKRRQAWAAPRSLHRRMGLDPRLGGARRRLLHPHPRRESGTSPTQSRTLTAPPGAAAQGCGQPAGGLAALAGLGARTPPSCCS